MNDTTNFLPDWACAPGETIRDLIEERGWSEVEFARKMGNTVDQIRNLLSGAMHLTEDVATRLTNIFGVSTSFWLSRENQYRDSLNRVAINEQWVRTLPTRDMVNLGWIDKVQSIQDKISECLKYFGVASVSDWYDRYSGSQTLSAFRTSKSYESHDGATLAWLRKGEIDSSFIECAPWNRELFHSSLSSIRHLTLEKSMDVFFPELQNICAQSGVAVVIVPTPQGCRASGATRFLSPTRALMMLSIRHLSDDHFWFTFFHEAGHLILHSNDSVFIEGSTNSNLQEQEADKFSSSLLIPDKYKEEMMKLPNELRAVMRFARRIGVSPGIVVGQLQHLGKCPHNHLNVLKVRYQR